MSKVILVKYKEITLGELTFNNNCFCYNVFENNVKKANNLGYPISLYEVDKNFVAQKLPYALDDFIPNEDTQLYKTAGLLQTDSSFTKLCKIAGLNLADNGLYVTLQ